MADKKPDEAREKRIRDTLAQMTLDEKIGQLSLINGAGGHVPESLRQTLVHGRIGAILNEVDQNTVNELQRIGIEESRLGIPLLIGRDVIHGSRTVFPIPLGQAAMWNPELVRTCARIAATEAASVGINWTFAFSSGWWGFVFPVWIFKFTDILGIPKSVNRNRNLTPFWALSASNPDPPFRTVTICC